MLAKSAITDYATNIQPMTFHLALLFMNVLMTRVCWPPFGLQDAKLDWSKWQSLTF